MADEWGNPPQKVENSWPMAKPTNNDSTADDYGRKNIRGLGLGLPPASNGAEDLWNNEAAPTQYNREQMKYQDANNDRKKLLSNSGDWNDNNNDLKKRSFNDDGWNSQNQRLEKRDDDFNSRRKSHQTSNNDNKTELYDTHVSSQKGFDYDSRNLGRSPTPTTDYDRRKDQRNFRGPHYSYENDSRSRKPREASHDKFTNVIDSPSRPSHAARDELDDESLALQEVIHNSFSARQTGKQFANDPESERWIGETKKLTEPATPGMRRNEKEYKDKAVQTEPIDLEPIVQMVCSTNPDVGDVLRKKLFSLGIYVNVGGNTSGRPLMDIEANELNDHEKIKVNVRKDFDGQWRSSSVSRSAAQPPTVANDLRRPASSWNDDGHEVSDKLNDDYNYQKKEFRSRQPINDFVSARDSSVTSTSKESKPWDSSNIPKIKDPSRPTSVKSLEPWETSEDKPRKSDIRSPSPSKSSRPRDFSHPPSPDEPWRNRSDGQKKSEFWDTNTSRIKSSDSRDHSPNHVSRDRKHENALENVSRQGNDPRRDDESRVYAPGKDPRTASRDSYKPRDNSDSSRVAQPWIGTQRNIDPQEVTVKKPNEKLDSYTPLPNTDTWDSNKGTSASNNNWLEKAALFKEQISGRQVTEENEKPLKKESEPWEKPRSDEPWVTASYEDNLPGSNMNNNDDTIENETRSWNKNLSSDNSWNKQDKNSFNSRVEQRDDYYDNGHRDRDRGGSRDARGTEKSCYNCRKPGHLSRDCPEDSISTAINLVIGQSSVLKKVDHVLDVETQLTSQLYIVVNPEPSGISREEAWSRLMKADRENDIDDFNKWLEEFAKASPEDTFQTIERRLRSHNCNGKIIALKREGIPLTSCLIDLQGNTGKEFVAQPVCSTTFRPAPASGTIASSEEENFRWLADAGFLRDDPSPICFNCKYCDRRDGNGERGEKSYGGYNGRGGYGDKDIRGKGGVKCYNCGEEGHMSKDCRNPRREHGRHDKFSDSNPYANGTYEDDRKYSSKWEYNNDGRDGGKRARGRDNTDDYSSANDRYQNDNFNKNRYNASRGSNYNDDKDFNRNRGGFNEGYQPRDSNQRGINRDADFNLREDRDQGRNFGRNFANRDYDFSSRGNRDGDRAYPNRDKREDHDRDFDRKRDDYSFGNKQDRSREPITRRWEARDRSISNANRNDDGPTLKKESWDQKPVIQEDTSDEWERKRNEVMATWGPTSNQKSENKSWPPQDERKDSFNKIPGERYPRGSKEELRGRSSETKEVFASAPNPEPSKDLTWYSKEGKQNQARLDEIKAVKEAEADVMAEFLGASKKKVVTGNVTHQELSNVLKREQDNDEEDNEILKEVTKDATKGLGRVSAGEIMLAEVETINEKHLTKKNDDNDDSLSTLPHESAHSKTVSAVASIDQFEDRESQKA
ncbi:13552_t:CDS:10 [Acaulospora colombiana]|uniref:13552_t:CDS:1 n=1 Tax=Acaulospora colombiana TaxID=27376 RepID=A0ACA9KJ16_9GLOM|nr:13552_t:CDS:10 [Acaulospora colombiana]